jgi:hypothetical protein
VGSVIATEAPHVSTESAPVVFPSVSTVRLRRYAGENESVFYLEMSPCVF